MFFYNIDTGNSWFEDYEDELHEKFNPSKASTADVKRPSTDPKKNPTEVKFKDVEGNEKDRQKQGTKDSYSELRKRRNSNRAYKPEAPKDTTIQPMATANKPKVIRTKSGKNRQQ